MAGPLADLSVAGRLLLRTLGRRLRGEIQPAPNLDAFARGLQDLLDSLPRGTVRQAQWLDMPASRPPWQGSGITLAPGDEVSYFLAGRAYANKSLDIYVSPQLQVWARIGAAGDIFRGTRRSHSFVAGDDGELCFGNYFPNDWADVHGARLQDDSVYAGVSGDLKILAVLWSGGAREGLQSMLAAGDHEGLVSGEIVRLDAGDTTPRGWTYLWNVGPAEIFRDQHNSQGQPCVHCDTRSDVGILQKTVDLPLLDDTEISWRWCVDSLPISLREDTVPSHDYLSIAVEFDNGRDITYYWSSSLPEGTGYDCPLPNWQGKEYHVVVRSGSQGLGEWLEERRNLMADYRHYMGEPPARIVKVWFIANSIFQRGHGQCTYADIHLRSGGEDVHVL